jgi:outer membrane receptor protein involved in Fe transport
MKKPLFRLSCLSLILFSSSCLFAGDGSNLDRYLSMSLEDLMAVKVKIATNTEKDIRKAPSVISVITQEDLKLTGATNLADALQSVPGLHITPSYFGNRPNPHFRGLAAAKTLLMINGNSTRDLVWGFGIFWKGLPVSAIDRVEIIRGPGSALFGADAIAGVINVITKTAGDIKDSEVGLRAGSFDTQSAWMQHGTEVNGYRLGFTADISTTEGHDPLIESDTLSKGSYSLAPDKAQYGYDNLDLRMSVARDNWQLLLSYLEHNNLETGLTGAGILDPLTEGNDDRLNIDWLYSNPDFTKNWGIDLEARFQDLSYSSGDGFQETPPGFTDGTGTFADGQLNQMRASERHYHVNVSGLYHGIKAHEIKLGMGYQVQDLYKTQQYVNFGTRPDGSTIMAGDGFTDLTDTALVFAPEDNRENFYSYVQDIWSISQELELTAGLRYDNYSDFGDSWNPRLALVWHPNDKVTAKFLYGEAFQAPNFQQLYAETSRSLPNPDLEPETSSTFDLGFTYTPNRKVLFGMNLFYLELENIISLVSGQYQNGEDHWVSGIELEARWQVSPSLGLSGNYTVRDQDNSGFEQINQPKQDAYLRMDWSFQPKWNWNVQANWVDDMERGSGRDARYENYLIADTTLRYGATDELEFAASIRNLFDEDAREYIGGSNNTVPLAERNGFIEVRYKFK